MSNSNRYEYIDLMKGFCILLVVMNHCDIPIIQNSNILTTFRMPLYFIISGLFFKRYSNIIEFGIKKTNSLVVPYIVTFILYNLTLYFVSSYLDTPFVFKKYPRSIWFLASLFEVSCIYYLISLARNIYTQSIISLSISLIGFYLFKNGIELPYYTYYISASISAVIFYHYGTVLKTIEVLKPSKQIYNWVGLVSFILLFIFIDYNFYVERLKLRFNVYPGSFILTQILALGGTLIVFFLSRILKHLPVISYLGRYSIIVLCFHIIYLYLFEQLLVGYFSPDLAPYFKLAFVLLLMYPTITFVVRYIPFLFSQKQIIAHPDVLSSKIINDTIIAKLKPLFSFIK